MQSRGVLVAPTALRQISVPDFNFFVGWLASLRESPIENLLIPFPLERPLLQCLIANSKKVATLPVKSVHGSLGRHPLWRQFPLMKQTNLSSIRPKCTIPPTVSRGLRRRGIRAFPSTLVYRDLAGRPENEAGALRQHQRSRKRSETTRSVTPAFLTCLSKRGGAFVAPAALLHEAVPDLDIFVGWSFDQSRKPIGRSLRLFQSL